MRSSAIFSRCLGFVLLIIISHFYGPLLCRAQAREPATPKISLTIFLVPEKEACKPSGYRTIEDESTNCQPLVSEDIERWRKLGVISQTIKIPPGQISLNNLMLRILDSYVRDRVKTPDQRLAAVFLFKWETPQQLTLLLERKVGPKYADIPAMKWSGLLNNKTLWIHQERADALLPVYNINWILKAGHNIWNFHFVRK